MTAEEHTLLVVDDSDENREVLARRLLKRGFSVLEAEGGRQALDLIASRPVDLVLLDIMMPGMSGLEVLEELRRTRSPAELPVIMVTAKTDSEDIVVALEAGASDYVTKPVDFPVVLARVQAQLRLKQARGPERKQREAAEPLGAPAGDEIRPGGLLADRYRLESRIGAGGFGAVYRAVHLELDSPVALKVLQTSVAKDADAIARFRREGISACRVRHPNAVAVLDFGVTAAGTAYLVMELLEGHSLLEELMRRRALSPARAAQVLVPVCDVLAAAHDAGIIHRDVKPSNVFLQRTPVGELVKVLDFGIAKIAGEGALKEQLTVEGAILGTPAYMAPERFRNRPYDGKSDVYSVGVMLHQLLEGRLPFVAGSDPLAVAMMHMNEPPPRLLVPAPAVREPLQRLVDRALAKSPGERPGAAELAASLREVVGALGEQATLDPALAAGEPGAGGDTVASGGGQVSADTLRAADATSRDPEATERTGPADAKPGDRRQAG